ncbi:MAG: RNA polymerase sigma factor [Ginsengibacter sp.]
MNKINTSIGEAFSPALVTRMPINNPLTSKGNWMSVEELSINIEGCTLNNRTSQKKIYGSFYSYAMAICDRYTNCRDDAIEILNDGFLKIFKDIHRYKPAYANTVSSFKGWLRKIIINTAIDHFRKNHKYWFTKDIEHEPTQLPTTGEDVLDIISYNEIIKSIKELTPGYRTVFNLFIIEGFRHEEISEQLGISIGASKSNLSKARRQLQKILLDQNKIEATQDERCPINSAFALGNA